MSNQNTVLLGWSQNDLQDTCQWYRDLFDVTKDIPRVVRFASSPCYNGTTCMGIWEELHGRNYVHAATPGMREHIATPRTWYWGFDPTSGSLHIGSLLGLLVLKKAVEYGHQAIVLVGGSTGLIGDPSGKNAERPLADKDLIAKNTEKCLDQVRRFLPEGERVIYVNNYDWTKQVTYLEFLRDVGKYITIASMLDKDSVATRMQKQEGISYAEFSYQLLQAYDFMHLNEAHACTVQVGGSDQWGNIIQGVELTRKKSGNEVCAMCFPLLTDPQTGKKIGKTEKGNLISLDPSVTHPYALYQFLLNLPDELAIKMFPMFSPRSITEIEQELQNAKESEEVRYLQLRLAKAVIALVHGEEVVAQLERTSHIIFSREYDSLTENDISFLRGSIAITEMTRDATLAEQLLQLGLVSSKGEAQRLIAQQGIKSFSLVGDRYALLQRGKKDFGIVKYI